MTRTTFALLGLWILLALGTLAVPVAADDGVPGLIRPPATTARAVSPSPAIASAVLPCPTCPNGVVVAGPHPGAPPHYAGITTSYGPRGLYGQDAYNPYTCKVRHQPLIDPHTRADWIAANRAAAESWHAGYYNTQYGAPVALVVPPQSRMQTRWGWGVSQSTMSPIYHQFERPYPGPVMVDPATGMGPSALLPTPPWPSHTDQFGVYYVRGPW
jgi:hypothetical protein